MNEGVSRYVPVHQIRFVTASALFDGHDASITIMRRILQASGAEVIHLGHNRSVREIIKAAIQEDVQGIAVSSYQGGHVAFFKYMVDSLRESGAGHIRIFGGGGGVILPAEAEELHRYGVTRIFSPEDGRRLGLQGMINVMLEACDYSTVADFGDKPAELGTGNDRITARFMTLAEQRVAAAATEAARLGELFADVALVAGGAPVLGITGTGGAGKSSLTDEFVHRYLQHDPLKTIAVLSVDPTKQKTGGALLGDRIRMNAVYSDRVFMRSFATRGSRSELSAAIADAIVTAKAAGYDLIVVETSGIGQADNQITAVADLSVYVMTSEFGAPSQLEKIEMIDYGDLIVINKFDRRGSEDALREVKKQVQRSRQQFDRNWQDMPVYGTNASQFNDAGMSRLFAAIMQKLSERGGEAGADAGAAGKVSAANGTDANATTAASDVTAASQTDQIGQPGQPSQKQTIIPDERSGYLSEIVQTVRRYKQLTEEQAAAARMCYRIEGTLEAAHSAGDENAIPSLERLRNSYFSKLNEASRTILQQWPALVKAYRNQTLTTTIRGQTFTNELYTRTLSGLDIPRVVLPTYEDWGQLIHWAYQENRPGEFPYTAGVFPFKREGEDPKRQFAGEGTPERTNRRFHYLSKGEQAKRLSTAFDSVTLYGEDPAYRPDIYGKIGESGVSVCTLDDMRKLYAGFRLCHPATSVSMTINGPAPMLLAMFMNIAIEQQQLEAAASKPGGTLTSEESADTRKQTLRTVRGTVQADILKEDQGQNTCLFSMPFALRMMGDIQQYFIDHDVRNYYSVSISGYHIAEAGANPITQLAFTLANGFTYVEYYLSRGMPINAFAPNLSFFFSNGLDAEYSVIGRVARRIWAVVLRDRYGADERSQKLKYHIQTSGRSLHAQEVDFNDIRTSLQALMAIMDNCNSLHTNSYDEAVTTPSEEAVRRAMAIQLIINKELGLMRCENLLQGSYLIEQLTDLVEEAVLLEFERLHVRGGVLGAMESQYQRGKIQDESYLYEMKKHSGELPIIGVNTFLNPQPKEHVAELQVARATPEEKEQQIAGLCSFHEQHKQTAPEALQRLKQIAISGGNLFEELMDTVKVASLGQITHALYEVGGQYRRNI
ncbi:fused isobutyryl-CoA mutase/GTPase IcmF [Paenibacillus sp. CF384]|uniref:fused isobutyryl-CoA mutase/GTPase IcmF n=1 Tax=Paenibacillus sp. CF384 TaxID=1884382 RepID=UPI00089C76C3|nr:fused isobutyryl-CoA mutase/GTPase IcmF [Paenibacillus sp. CF384]SDX45245.1 methylmalonyl-CoA mutase [Paenibacillus sp. CF384]